MACCKLICLKTFLTIGSLINIAMGVAFIALGEYLRTVDDIITLDIYTENKIYVFYFFLCSGFLLIVTGLGALYGALKKLKCLLFLYAITLFIFMLTFAGLAAIGYYGKSYISDSLGDPS